MILTAFLDESGTHGGDGTPENPGSATTVMAGMMGTALQWARFAGEIDALRRHYGFRTFHMKDFTHQTGEFEGWSRVRCQAFVNDFFPIIAPNRMMEGVTFRVDNAKFRSDYRGHGNPKRTRLDSAYGLCFRNCVLHLANQAQARLGHHKKWEATRLHIVLESGHKNSGDAARIFDELREDFNAINSRFLAPYALWQRTKALSLWWATFWLT